MCGTFKVTKRKTFFAGDYFINALNYCDYPRICYDIYKFTELRPNMLNGGITFTLYKFKAKLIGEKLILPVLKNMSIGYIETLIRITNF